MLKDILNRIERRLEAKGLTATEASRHAGLSGDAIRNIRRSVAANKSGGASTKTLEKLAPVLGTSVAWLAQGEGPEEERLTTRAVTVTAHVQAGVWTESWEWDSGDQYEVYIPDDPAYRNVKLYAAEARGLSMNRRYPEGTILVFTNIHETQEEPIPGKRYVVERKRISGEAEHTVKLLHVDAEGKYWLVPESDDPRFQAPISVEEGTGDGDVVSIIGRVCYAVMRE